jgi:hypothetical protein
MITEDLTGKRFNKLTVVGKVGTNKYRHILWECQCSCGNTTKTIGTSLKSGKTKSCGCIKHEYKPTHTTKHGKFGTKIYRTWGGIKYRCENINSKGYPRYGGRGISIYGPWSKSFMDFYNYMGDPPNENSSIERINNEGNYEPGNVRWATWKEQANNRRDTVIIQYKGKSMSISEWARLRGIKIGTLNARIQKYKWGIGRALNYENTEM